MLWEELGISFGTAMIVLIALYFVIKWGVKNGIRDYYDEYVKCKTDTDDIEEEELELSKEIIE